MISCVYVLIHTVDDPSTPSLSRGDHPSAAPYTCMPKIFDAGKSQVDTSKAQGMRVCVSVCVCVCVYSE
jgi:hypothetical protein